MAKSMRDRNGVELRMAARNSGKDGPAAYAELERRLGNLRGAVIPAWELEARGPYPPVRKIA